MAERRAWTYRPKRPHGGESRLLDALARSGRPPRQPVLLTLDDLVEDAGLTAQEAVVSLRELAGKGLLTVVPVPELRDIGQEKTYAVWLEPRVAAALLRRAGTDLVPGPSPDVAGG